MGRSHASTSTPGAKRRASARSGPRAGKRTAATKRPATAKRSATPKRKPATHGRPSAASAKRAASAKHPSGGRTSTRRTSSSRARSGPRRRPARPPGRRPRRARLSWRARFAIAAVLLAGLGAGYLFWLRDSSLVAVTDVEVVGVSSGDRERIVDELTRVGEQMTTLHVDAARIERAAGGFPTIESVAVDPNFPHGLRLEVVERPPRLLLRAGSEELPVAADGTLLTGAAFAADGLPVLELDQLPAGEALTGEPLEQAQIAGAAPDPLRPLIEELGYSERFGVEIALRGDLPVRFGSGWRAEEKWTALAAVLADPKLDAATYVDLRVPERPAVGGAG